MVAPSEQAAGAAALARRTTVRHYTQMNPGRTYPLLVIISAGKVERVVVQDVVQTESATGFTVTRESPMVRIEPVLPGCAVAPSSIELDCTVALAEAKFHVTPIIMGDIVEARIEVRHEGRVIDTVAIPTRVAKQTIAKVSAAFSAVSPVASQILKHYDARALKDGSLLGGLLGLVKDLETALGGPVELGLAAAGLGAIVAGVFYLRNRAKEGSPIVRFLDYSVALPAEGDLTIERLKARLVVLLHGEQRLISIRKKRTTIGRHPSCDVVLKDGSVRDHHAEIVFDGSTLRVKALGGAPMEVESRTATESDLRTDEVVLKLGKVPLLYFREARDDAIDAPDKRERLVEALKRNMPTFATEIDAAFAATDRPSRACAAELMVAGKLDIGAWRLSVARARL